MTAGGHSVNALPTHFGNKKALDPPDRGLVPLMGYFLALGAGLASGRMGPVAFGAATANWRVVDHHAASAATIHAAAKAIAASLDHLAALLVAAGAGHAETAVGHLETAQAHREVAVATGHAVHHAAAAAHPARQHGAKVLNHAARHLVVAHARQLAAPRALLDLEGATGHHHPIRARCHWRRRADCGCPIAWVTHARNHSSGTFHHHRVGHQSNSFHKPAITAGRPW
jgi:hypothetical protein